MSITALAVPNLRSHSLNPVRFSFEESDDTAVRFVVKIYFESFFGSNHYTLGAQFVQFPDDDGVIVFDAQEIMRGRVKPAQMGTYGSDPGNQPLSVQRYKYDITSKNATGEVLDTYEEDTAQYVYYGGIQWEQWLEGHFFDDWLPTQLSFLTWQPNNQKVDLLQRLFITYLPLEISVTLKMMIKIYRTSSADAPDEQTNYAVTELVPHTFICNLKDIISPGFDYTDTDIVKYDVWLAVSGTPVTEVRTYYIDRAVYRSKKRFVWANTIGGIDSIMCTGNYANEYEYAGDEALIYVAPDYDVVDGQYLAYDYEEQGKPVASTGWKTKAEIEHLRDALLSLQLFEDNGVQLLPVTIERETIRTFESEQKLFALQFRYKQLWKNRVFTGVGYDNSVRA